MTGHRTARATASSLPRLDAARICAFDLERFRPFVSDSYVDYFWLAPGEEHYKLLAYLSTCYHKTTIIDLGTDKGCSAMALSYNLSNRVISYDIVQRVSPINLPNIEFRVKDAPVEDRKELLSSPLILLDTAHDGIFEQRVYNALVEDGYQGLLLLDDICLNPVMQSFWPVGHWSGTGLVRF